MPNDLPIQPEPEFPAAAASTDGVELDLNFGFPVEDKNIFAELYETLRDIFFPPKLPPLELTSTPIPVPDRMAVKRNPLAVAASVLLNAGIIAVLVVTVVKPFIEKKAVVAMTPIDLTEPKIEGPHGGGGSPEKAPPVQGKTPPKMQAPDVAPKLLEPPPPTVDVIDDLPDNPKLPNFGMANSNVKLASGGNGRGIGMGNGQGSGVGDGTGGNWGGGLEHVGGKVSAPYQINQVEAEFSDEARRAKYQGIVMVAIIVDKLGNPQNPRVVRALGMGLDEKAIEAVMKYKFHPAMREGKPVAVPVNIEINFRLY
ncbi:MAG: TonB family protein [Terracidiphilus sp.]